MSGEGSESVATWLQEERGECTDMTLASLAVTLRKLRSEVPRIEALADQKDEEIVEARRRLREGVDVLAEMQELFLLQKKRILHGRKMEETINFINRSVGQEIITAKVLLQAVHAIRMDLADGKGGVGRTDNIEGAARKYGENVASALRDPEKRGRIVELARYFTQ